MPEPQPEPEPKLKPPKWGDPEPEPSQGGRLRNTDKNPTKKCNAKKRPDQRREERTFLSRDFHHHRSHRIVLVDDPRQRALKDWRHVLHVDHREDQVGRVVEAAVKDAQLNLVDLAFAIVEGLPERYGPAKHVNVGVARARHNVKVAAEVGRREAADLEDVADEVGVVRLQGAEDGRADGGVLVYRRLVRRPTEPENGGEKNGI